MASIIVAGATGAIGRTVVQAAIQQPAIASVVALTRATDISVENYDRLFGIALSSSTASVVIVRSEELQKIKPVSFDWEDFTDVWASARAAPDESSSDAAAVQEKLKKYEDLFSHHTYAAMCLGTTRGDAGSAKAFYRCDIDYTIAFTEAVLRYSAPAGLAPQNCFAYHVGHGASAAATSKQSNAKGREVGRNPSPDDPKSASSKTLRLLCHISASNAKADSFFLYSSAKGQSDEAAVERVVSHNRRVANPDEAVALLLIRPGLLDRHGKTRWVESMAKVLLPSMPVEKCGAAVVQACCRLSPSSPELQQLEDGSFGKLYTPSKRELKAVEAVQGKTSKDAFAHIVVAFNGDIKRIAAQSSTTATSPKREK